MSDGPHGLRKQEGAGDHLGINDSVPATCFPTACCSSSTWNVDLLEKMGRAIAEEALEYKVDVVLGPGVNIKEIHFVVEALNILVKIHMLQEN